MDEKNHHQPTKKTPPHHLQQSKQTTMPLEDGSTRPPFPSFFVVSESIWSAIESTTLPDEQVNNPRNKNQIRGQRGLKKPRDSPLSNFPHPLLFCVWFLFFPLVLLFLLISLLALSLLFFLLLTSMSW
jgi:hypothetical protein